MVHFFESMKHDSHNVILNNRYLPMPTTIAELQKRGRVDEIDFPFGEYIDRTNIMTAIENSGAANLFGGRKISGGCR